MSKYRIAHGTRLDEKQLYHNKNVWINLNNSLYGNVKIFFFNIQKLLLKNNDINH